jgi:hypothetical protein
MPRRPAASVEAKYTTTMRWPRYLWFTTTCTAIARAASST